MLSVEAPPRRLGPGAWRTTCAEEVSIATLRPCADCGKPCHGVRCRSCSNRYPKRFSRFNPTGNYWAKVSGGKNGSGRWPVLDRILARLLIGDGCWLWPGSTASGYGHLRGTLVHRAVYEGLRGPIPEGMQLDHLCRVRLCCNPSHLEPVTNRENILRGVGVSAENARKTHCRLGHPFDASNTWTDKRGGRHCRECGRASHRRWLARQAGGAA